MADGLATVALANAMLNGIRNTSFALAATYAQIHTAAPGAAGTTAVSVGSTVRPGLSFAAAASGSIAMTSTAPVWTNGGTTETITDESIWSANAAGTFYWSVQLTAPKGWASGDTLTQNTCTLALSPLAS